MLVRATCIRVVLRAHSVRGESRIQRNASGEVATTSTPFSTNRTDRAFFCEGFTQHDLHILITAKFCCYQKAGAACAQSFIL